ncbi:citrate synthase, putative [Babesia bigemina]|uniref:Citrate synthase n=1 Tax=Babesia bigemina TaxID=5866 RepID=A0A061CZF8_BABBI|nr:citrate synthase, putative [Babesia bigemina]CDR94011.1 citrate synthase, putative [Babesia bigemina]|eukprot:XP_012766197.1 citrate synthase, putative [Babesia bigemina]
MIGEVLRLSISSKNFNSYVIGSARAHFRRGIPCNGSESGRHYHANRVSSVLRGSAFSECKDGTPAVVNLRSCTIKDMLLTTRREESSSSALTAGSEGTRCERVTKAVDALPAASISSCGYPLARMTGMHPSKRPALNDALRLRHAYSFATHAAAADNVECGPGITALCSKIEELLRVKSEQLVTLRKEFGKVTVGEITVSQVLGGMRDIIGMNCETSLLDANRGITYRGLTIAELLEKLPGATEGNNCPYSEGVMWLLLTGKIPAASETKTLSAELGRRAYVPMHVFKVIDQLPTDVHPMTQYVAAVAALQSESKFRKVYNEKKYCKETAWRLVLDDSLNLIAANPLIVGYIYRRTFVDHTIKDGKGMTYDPELDYAANLAKLIGIDTPEFRDMMRLYIAVHADHEGGNVSAHTAHLIGSALADPYFCFAGALTGLSGPLHGLANQECLSWVNNMVKEMRGQEINVETVTKFAKDTLAKGQVIPGYGHAVLRVEDPRHTAFVKFAHKHFPDDPLVKILDVCLEAIPPVLMATGKIKSPHPNVDCSTGIILSHFGIKEPDMYTVFFGISRAIGILAQLVWARALKMPIERPKSHTLDSLLEMCK